MIELKVEKNYMIGLYIEGKLVATMTRHQAENIYRELGYKIEEIKY